MLTWLLLNPVWEVLFPLYTRGRIHCLSQGHTASSGVNPGTVTPDARCNPCHPSQLKSVIY